MSASIGDFFEMGSLRSFRHLAAARYGRANSAIARFAGPTAGSLAFKPSEYWSRQCYVGASFMRPVECAER